MDIKPYLIKVIIDADLREKFLRTLPSLFDNYFITKQGEVLTKKELEKLQALNYSLDELNSIGSSVNS